MKTAGVAELKARLSEYLATVKAGGEVLITERGKPIARISPVETEMSFPAHLVEMAKQGLVKLPTKKLDREFLRMERPKDATGSVLAALLAEREESW